MAPAQRSATNMSGELTDEGGPLDFSSFMEGLAHDIKGLARAEKRYLTMQVTEKAGTLIGKSFHLTIVIVAVAMALLFLCLGLGFYLGMLLHSDALGFTLVGGLYLLFLGCFQLWWSAGGRDRFVLERINDLNTDDETQ